MGLLRADLYKLVRHGLLRWLAVILVALVLLRGVAWPPGPEHPRTGLLNFELVTLALVMLTAVMAGMEFTEDTFRSLVSRGIPRWWLLLSKVAVLLLVGVLLLMAIQGLASLLNLRPGLRWDEVLRAWLSLLPYISVTLLLTVLARNGGLPLVIGVMWIALEYSVGAFLGPMSLLAEMPQARFFTHRGFLGGAYRWSLSYNSANWTYLGEALRAPAEVSTTLQLMPGTALQSAFVLVAHTLVALSLCILVVYRRDMTETVEGKKGLFGRARRRPQPEQTRARRRSGGLPRATGRQPTWIGRGPMLMRLTGGHLFKMGRTSLPKIGAAVSLLFPLVLWGAARALQATGYEDVLFRSPPEGGSPLAIAAGLMVVGPLATVLGIQAVSSELILGTRRAELTRGVTRAQTIIAQSVALVLTLGAVFTFLVGVTLLIGAGLSGSWYLGGAIVTILVSLLAASAYLGAVQVGGALTRSPFGAMLFGLGFLVADWLAILGPTLMMETPGIVSNLGSYAVFANTFTLANRGEIVGVGVEWPHLSPSAAVLLLLGYAVASHGLAVLIARWRDA